MKPANEQAVKGLFSTADKRKCQNYEVRCSVFRLLPYWSDNWIIGNKMNWLIIKTIPYATFISRIRTRSHPHYAALPRRETFL